MGQIKSYDDIFQNIRALTVQKILKIRILSIVRTALNILFRRKLSVFKEIMRFNKLLANED